MSKFVILLVNIYRLVLSPLFPSSCRYFPSCSEYSKDALEKHGFYTGMKLTLKRILKCNPWGSHGYDPVPDIKQEGN